MDCGRIVVTVAFAVAGCGLLSSVHAEEQGAYDQSATILYREGPARKLGRGVANMATGIAELPLAMERTAKEEGQVAGATLGALRGVGMTVARTLAGGFETATFLFPSPNVGYAPLMNPEYLSLEDLL